MKEITELATDYGHSNLLANKLSQLNKIYFDVLVETFKFEGEVRTEIKTMSSTEHLVVVNANELTIAFLYIDGKVKSYRFVELNDFWDSAIFNMFFNSDKFNNITMSTRIHSAQNILIQVNSIADVIKHLIELEQEARADEVLSNL